MESLTEGFSETSGMDETALDENVLQLKHVLEPRRCLRESLLQIKKKTGVLEDLGIYGVGRGRGTNAENQEIKFRKTGEPGDMIW